jgi:hypothetical protein
MIGSGIPIIQSRRPLSMALSFPIRPSVCKGNSKKITIVHFRDCLHARSGMMEHRPAKRDC